MRARFLRTLLLSALSATTLLFGETASANGRFPAANQLVLTPEHPDELVLRATFGILLSSDRGRTWDWLCELAVGYGGIWDPPLGVFSSRAIMAGTIDGLALSPDHGCAWSYVPGALTRRPIIDVVIRGEAPSQGVVLASSNDGEDDAGATLFKTELFATEDGGVTWTALAGTFAPHFIAQTLEVARSDPDRLYVSGSESGGGVVYVSYDRGASFEKRAFPLDTPTERHPFLAAVDPNDADRIYVRTSGGTSRLLVSDDAGLTYRAVFLGPPLLGFALSPDGSRVWVGASNGLFTASTSDLSFSQLGDRAIQCLTATADTLYACVGDAREPYVLGASSDGGRTFTSVLTLDGIRGPIACDASLRGAECVQDWPATKAFLSPGAVESTPDASAPAPSPALGPYEAGGGCSVGHGAAAGGLALVSAVALAFALRRRRASPARR